MNLFSLFEGDTNTDIGVMLKRIQIMIHKIHNSNKILHQAPINSFSNYQNKYKVRCFMDKKINDWQIYSLNMIHL